VVDVKAENLERRVQVLEDERAGFESKIEELDAKYKETKQELEDTLASLNDM
jgi:tropomyosin